MPARQTAHAAARRWNDQWWDYVKNSTPLPQEQARPERQPDKPVLQFIIVKGSRYLDETAATVLDAYAGPTCRRAGVPPGKVYTSFEAAQADAAKLTKKNAAGFDVLTLPT